MGVTDEKDGECAGIEDFKGFSGVNSIRK